MLGRAAPQRQAQRGTERVSGSQLQGRQRLLRWIRPLVVWYLHLAQLPRAETPQAASNSRSLDRRARHRCRQCRDGMLRARASGLRVGNHHAACVSCSVAHGDGPVRNLHSSTNGVTDRQPCLPFPDCRRAGRHDLHPGNRRRTEGRHVGSHLSGRGGWMPLPARPRSMDRYLAGATPTHIRGCQRRPERRLPLGHLRR